MPQPLARSAVERLHSAGLSLEQARSALLFLTNVFKTETFATEPVRARARCSPGGAAMHVVFVRLRGQERLVRDEALMKKIRDLKGAVPTRQFCPTVAAPTLRAALAAQAAC